RRKGNTRPNLRDRAAQAVCISDSVYLHSLARHAHGKEEGSNGDPAAQPVAVAANDEMLEDESSRRGLYLVGAVGVATGFGSDVAVQAATAERPQFYLALVDVLGSCFGEEPRPDGQDLPG